MIWHCSSCGKRFKYRLQKARRTPEGRKIFACPICGSGRIESIQ